MLIIAQLLVIPHVAHLGNEKAVIIEKDLLKEPIVTRIGLPFFSLFMQPLL